MQPPALNLIPTIQQAITSLLTVYEPEFLRFVAEEVRVVGGAVRALGLTAQ